MSRKLLEKLAAKFAHEHFEQSSIEEQKEKLEIFYYDNIGALKNIINEMAGDLLIIKEKNLPLDLRQLLGKIYQQVIDFYKEIDPENPYPGALNFINWINAKHNKSLLENLDFLIKKHLEKKEISFYGKDSLKQPSANSINKLLDLSQDLKQYIINNPIMPTSFKLNLDKIEEPTPSKRSGPEDPTELY